MQVVIVLFNISKFLYINFNRLYIELNTPIIIVDTYTLDISNDFSYLTNLALYISFSQACLLIIMSLILRFIKWRILVFVYISYIFFQCYIIYFVLQKSNNITIKLKEIDYYSSIILDILSTLLLPFGNKLRIIVKHINNSTNYNILYAGGVSGLFIYTPKNRIWGLEQTQESFSRKFLHPIEKPSPLYTEFSIALSDLNFSNCNKLLSSSTIKETLQIMHTTTYFMKHNTPKEFNQPAFINMFRKEFLGISNRTLLAKVEGSNYVRYMFPKMQTEDLNAIDSSQKLVSDSENLYIVMKQECQKLEELYHAALFAEGNSVAVSFIFPVAEPGTRTDYYIEQCINQKEEAILASKIDGNIRHFHKDIKESGLDPLGIDLCRTNASKSVYDVVEKFKKEKIMPLQKVGRLPQNEHHLCSVVTNNPSKANKELIDNEINNIIKQNLHSFGDLKVIYKSLIDPFK